MDNLQKLRRRAHMYLSGLLLLENALVLGAGWALYRYGGLAAVPTLLITLFIGTVITFIISHMAVSFLTEPLKALWQAILHLSPTEQGIAAPKVESLKFGRELVAGLCAQIYQLASVADSAVAEATKQAGDLSGTTS